MKIPKNISKSILQIFYSCSVQKTARKKHEIFKKWDHFQNGASCKGYSLCKILTLAQKLKFQKKKGKIHFTNHLELFCVKKKEIFQKWDHFQNGPSCIGYSLCKILTLAQKLKFQTTWQNPFYKPFKVFVCKKPLEKTRNFQEIRKHFQNGRSCKGCSLCKILTLAQNLNFQKNMSKSILQII